MRNEITEIASEKLPLLGEHPMAMKVAENAKVGDDLKSKCRML